MARGLGLAGAILLVSWSSTVVWSQQRAEYPRPRLHGRVTNQREWGVYRPIWRTWPGEERLDVDNPRAVLSNVLPTPEGQETKTLPRVIMPKTPPSAILPEEPKSEPGGFLSPENMKVQSP